MIKLAKLSGFWYVIDFGQRAYWKVGSSSHLEWLRNDARIPVIDGEGSSSVLSGYVRLSNSDA